MSVQADVGTLLTVLAHDLRNPLAALLTNVNFVRSSLEGHSRDLDGALIDATLSCALLTQLVGNLDVLSVVLAEPAPLQRALPLRELANEAVGRFAAAAALTGLRVEVALETPSPAVMADAVFVGRALDNLLANAMQYSLEAGAVTISSTHGADSAAIIITDDGPIVPQAMREVVLTAEGQLLAKSSSGGRYGRGLGLFCAAQAARVAGGELAVGEHQGRAAFVLSLPRAPSAR